MQMFVERFAHNFGLDYCIIVLICTQNEELMKSWGGLWLLFMMKVMVWHFLSSSHQVMTGLFLHLIFIMLWRFLCNFIWTSWRGTSSSAHIAFLNVREIRSQMDVHWQWVGVWGFCKWAVDLIVPGSFNDSWILFWYQIPSAAVHSAVLLLNIIGVDSGEYSLPVPVKE